MPILSSLSVLGAHFSSPMVHSRYGSFAGSTYLTASQEVNINTGDFTFEAFIYPTAYDSNGQATLSNSHGNGGLALYFQSQTGWLVAGGPNGFGNAFISNNPVVLNEWQHLAIVRSSGSVSIYINGVLDSTTSDGSDYGSFIYDISHSSGGFAFIGNMANVRISNNARYSGNSFSVPTTAFSSDANTLLLALNSAILENELTNYGVTLVGISS